ncbi:hypothetical protein CAEBREN_24405 [Caenorhabditis brenneri]|uniref:Uncharacterized protein n=1 Tax=Caenorhabditis brenneri TaxID=135651 RepID=G0NKZ4_CAEBE|nr:hypothetical protein CAEBREN_24405 [Caenorhabditis brenneri]
MFLTIALLVLVITDLYTYDWNTNNQGTSGGSTKLAWCTPWSIQECSNLWRGMGIRHKIALTLHLCLIPLTIAMVLATSLAVLTRVMRKRVFILILIFISWVTLITLFATVFLRMNRYNTNNTACLLADQFVYFYHDHWQIYITLASLILSFVITQLFAYAGYFRPMITMLTFEGNYQRYDYPRMTNLENNMVSVKEIDSF